MTVIYGKIVKKSFLGNTVLGVFPEIFLRNILFGNVKVRVKNYT